MRIIERSIINHPTIVEEDTTFIAPEGANLIIDAPVLAVRNPVTLCFRAANIISTQNAVFTVPEAGVSFLATGDVRIDAKPFHGIYGGELPTGEELYQLHSGSLRINCRGRAMLGGHGKTFIHDELKQRVKPAM